MGHLEEAAARIRCQGGVGAIRQQDSHHVQVVILHGIVDGPARTGKYIYFDDTGDWFSLSVRYENLKKTGTDLHVNFTKGGGGDSPSLELVCVLWCFIDENQHIDGDV